MLRFARFQVFGVVALLSACGQAPMGASEGAAPPPADAPASAPPGPDFSGDFNLVGTEPFWNGRIRGDGLTLMRPGQPDVDVANGGVRVEGDVGAWGTGRLVFRLEAEPCSDGMSDRKYDYRAEARIDGAVLKGCAVAPTRLGEQAKP